MHTGIYLRLKSREYFWFSLSLTGLISIWCFVGIGFHFCLCISFMDNVPIILGFLWFSLTKTFRFIPISLIQPTQIEDIQTHNTADSKWWGLKQFKISVIHYYKTTVVRVILSIATIISELIVSITIPIRSAIIFQNQESATNVIFKISMPRTDLTLLMLWTYIGLILIYWLIGIAELIILSIDLKSIIKLKDRINSEKKTN